MEILKAGMTTLAVLAVLGAIVFALTGELKTSPAIASNANATASIQHSEEGISNMTSLFGLLGLLIVFAAIFGILKFFGKI